ncbi:MAG TPA: hypothetical protein VE908_19080 [Mycobacterium sp.]|nr:hypothetical protein [Mycobacterium sp.]
MRILSNNGLGLAMSAGALIAAVGLGVQTGDFATHVQVAADAPVHFSPPPPSPPPPPPPATNYDPTQDYWTGQGSAGGAPGGAGGGGGGGGGAGGGG